MRFVSPLAAGVGVVTVPAPAGIPWRVGLGGGRRSRSRSDGPSPRPGREPAVGHALDRAARHRRPARPHRSPAGPDGATGPVHRGLPVRRSGRGASRGRPVRRRGLLRPLLVGRPVGPAAGHATRPGGRRLDPLQGKTPRARLRQAPRARGHPDRGGRSHDRVG